ncbi:hypothetical protein SDC9_168937 [bioreactor metagenome]|uniref:Uncharacterized protein n=1 Tax=bioreactor metagenome TaxID=1076179 RepID=A0A645G3T0_9ZZZZ
MRAGFWVDGVNAIVRASVAQQLIRRIAPVAAPGRATQHSKQITSRTGFVAIGAWLIQRQLGNFSGVVPLVRRIPAMGQKVLSGLLICRVLGCVMQFHHIAP